jgi:hypothetical protein
VLPVGFEAPQRKRVGFSEVSDAEPGGTLGMRIEPGALGISWIADRSVVSAPLVRPAT